MNNIPTPEQERKMNRADERLRNIIRDFLNKDSILLIPQIIYKSSDGASHLDILACEGYKKGLITIYEAFQLYEIHDRLCTKPFDWGYEFYQAVESLNMALMAKLFEEEDMYKSFCEDTKIRYDSRTSYVLKENKGKMPKSKPDEFYDDLTAFLKGDKDHLEFLRDKRMHTKGIAKQNAVGRHFSVFPFDLFKYEDELLKVVNGEIEHYPVDKNISPVVCDIMTAAEVRDYEVKKGYF